MKLNRIFYKALIVLVVTGLIASCEQGGFFGIGTSAQYSLVPTEGLSTDSIPQGDFFYVNLSASYYYGKEFDPLDAIIYAMDQGPGADCKIPIEAESTEDLYCILDVMEGDLYLHKMVLEYNVPPEMCQYTSRIVPWHFNRPTGLGPQVITHCEVCLHSPEHQNCLTSEDCTNTEKNCGGTNDEGEPTPGEWKAGYLEGRKSRSECARASNNFSEDIKEFCGYQTTGAGTDAPINHCCYGSYRIYPPGVSDTEYKSSGFWPENFDYCLGGPGRFSWPEKDKSGFPKKIITPTQKKGLKENYEIDAIINIYDNRETGRHPRLPLSFITANYWEDARDKAFGEEGNSLPQMYYSADSDQTRIGEPYFVWSCLDSAKEVQHRIILLLREWNTKEEFNNFKESLGSNGDPDLIGDEGEACDYYTSDEVGLFPLDSNCNDLEDLDDWIKGDDTYPRVVYKGDDED